MDYKINIAQLTWQVFGFPGYLPSLPPPQGEGEKFPDLESTKIITGFKQPSIDDRRVGLMTETTDPKQGVLKTETKMGDSLLGQPLFDMLIFGEYDPTQEYGIAKELSLTDSPIVSVARKRTIVKTPITGRKSGGTIKEFVSGQDYAITVSGLLADPEDRMPWDKLEALNTFLNSDKCYKAYSRLFHYLGINYVVVDEIKEIKPMDGYSNIIQYSFTLLSDDAPEISL